MPEDPYRALARRLDEIPNGFPATASGSELRLLAALFTPEQAALATQMRLTAETSAEIAARTGQEPAAVHALLKVMVRRGLVHATREGREFHFSLLPFAIGLYEFQGDRMDAELAELVEAYFQEAHPRMFAVNPPLQRVIPVEEAVPLGVEILPYERASEILDRAAAWGETDCICRRQQKLVGRGCDRPHDLCMVMSDVPGAFDQARGIRALTREEAYAELRRAEEAGLVHSTSNTRGPLPYLSYICNCCPCCCGILRGVTEFGMANSIAHAALRCVVDETRCAGCETCLERCHFGALTVEGGVAQIDPERCAGCGLCTTTCPSDALSLQPRPQGEVRPVPEDLDAWWAERAQSRGIDLGKVL